MSKVTYFGAGLVILLFFCNNPNPLKIKEGRNPFVGRRAPFNISPMPKRKSPCKVHPYANPLLTISLTCEGDKSKT